MSSEELFSQEPNEQNRMEWPNLAIMSEHYQLSDRALSTIWHVIDKNRLRREIEKYINIISEDEAIFYKFIDGIYIDGRMLPY